MPYSGGIGQQARDIQFFWIEHLVMSEGSYCLIGGLVFFFKRMVFSRSRLLFFHNRKAC
jgi:hypothetical protein